MVELNENSMRLMLDNNTTIREEIEEATGLKRYATRSLLIDGSIEKATEEQLNSIADIINVSTSELVRYLHKRNKEYVEYFDVKESDTTFFNNKTKQQKRSRLKC